jgi:hypothetical protein
VEEVCQRKGALANTRGAWLPRVIFPRLATAVEKRNAGPECFRDRHFSRCAAKTELCVTVVSLSPGFFRFRGLNGIFKLRRA